MFLIWLTFSFASTPPPIVNGSYTSDFMAVGAFVQCYGSYGCGSFCSGTLIAPRYVITAAHCVEDLSSYGEYYFLFGNNIGNSDAYGEVIDWVAHEGYSGTNSQTISDDIAVVEINGVFDLATQQEYNILPISLNRQEVSTRWIGDELQMVGYGITRTGREDSGYKRTVDMPIYDFDDQFVYVYDPSEQQNVCSGDSGGAALSYQEGGLVLVGVNSFTYGECETYFAGVARVDQYTEWIDSKVEYFEQSVIHPFNTDTYPENTKKVRAACQQSMTSQDWWMFFFVFFGLYSRKR